MTPPRPAQPPRVLLPSRPAPAGQAAAAAARCLLLQPSAAAPSRWAGGGGGTDSAARPRSAESLSLECAPGPGRAGMRDPRAEGGVPAAAARGGVCGSRAAAAPPARPVTTSVWRRQPPVSVLSGRQIGLTARRDRRDRRNGALRRAEFERCDGSAAITAALAASGTGRGRGRLSRPSSRP